MTATALSCLHRLRRTLLLIGLALPALASQAGSVSVAVAANFAAPMKLIAEAFERDTGHKAVLSIGATGQFHAQIKNGAPFELLLAADAQTPLKLEQEGLTLAGTRRTYAIGRLVLWSRTPGLVDESGQVLRSGKFEKLALAKPKLAPYGAAAWQVLDKLSLSEALKPRIVEAASIGQTLQFVASGNAALGFVAMAQVFEGGKLREGSAWVVPEQMHTPLRQDMVLLLPGRDKPAALALLAYLQSPRAQAIVQSFGYAL
ncbi:MAG: molybdate ABC transporter substrate-binding protein [Betaproteobacteria bacterium]